MRRCAATAIALAAMVAALAVGCADPGVGRPAAGPRPSNAAPQPRQSQATSGGVQPMGGVGAGPMTPVSGSESFEGGGSGVGSALKAKAKGIAGSAGQQPQSDASGE